MPRAGEAVVEQGSEELLKRSLARLNEAEAALSNMPRLRLLTPNTKSRVPVLSFVHEDYDPLEIGSILATNDIHVRTGFHCAPWIHEHLRTTTSGTVRISTGPETTEHDVQAFLTVMRSL